MIICIGAYHHVDLDIAHVGVHYLLLELIVNINALFHKAILGSLTIGLFMSTEPLVQVL